MSLITLFENATPDYNMREKYEKFNQELFGGKLPRVMMQWKPMKGVSGQVSAKFMAPVTYKKKSRVAKRYDQAKIDWDTVALSLCNMFKRTEAEYDGVMVHEMIHLLMWMEGRLGEDHGRVFLATLHDLQKKVDFKIPVTEHIGVAEFTDSQKTPEEVGVLVVTDSNGRNSFVIGSAKVVARDAEMIREEWWKIISGPQARWIQSVSLMVTKDMAWTAVAAQHKKSIKFGPSAARFILPKETLAQLEPGLAKPERLLFHFER